MWEAIILIVVAIVSYALTAKPPTPKPAALDDFEVPTAEEGRAIPWVFGEGWLTGYNVLWYGDLGTQRIKKSTGLDKKTVGYWYMMGLHMAMCKGPVDMVIAIMAGERIAWSASITESREVFIDAKSLFGGKDKEGGLEGTLEILMGAPDQQPNSYLAARQGGGHNPAYRGVLTAVYKKGYVSAMSPYLKNWAWRVRRNKAGWERGSPWYPEKCEIDVGPQGNLKPPTPSANLKVRIELIKKKPPPEQAAPPTRILCANAAHIIYEILTDTEDGMGHPAGLLDDESFRYAADLYHAEGLGLWVKWVRTDTIESTLQNVLDHVNTLLVQDPQTLKFQLIPMRYDYVLEELETYGPNDSYDVPCTLESFDRGTIEEVVNEITVTWDDSSDNQPGSVTVQNPAAIQAAGGVVNQTKAYACCPTQAIAARLAQRDCDVMSAMLSRVRIRCDRRAFRSKPGKVINFSWPARGVVNMPLRILRVNSSGKDNTITIEGTEDVFGFGLATYIKPQPPGWVDPIGEPEGSPLVDAIELPFRSLVTKLGPEVAAAVPAAAGYAGMFAAEPATLATGFTAYSQLPDGNFADEGDSDFTPVATLVEPLGKTDTTMVLGGLSGEWDTIQAGQPGWIGEHPNAEAVVMLSMDADTGEVTIARGSLDTVPRTWPAGAKVWADDFASSQGVTQFAAGQVVKLRALTLSSAGESDIEQAPEDTVTIAGRAGKPYPPARMRINGQDAPTTVAGTFAVTWVHRDRDLQGVALLGQQEPDVGPNALTRYGLQAVVGGTVLVSRGDIAGNQASVVLDHTGPVTIRLFAVNDNGTSWQAWEQVIDYTPPSPAVPSAITAPTWERPYTIIDGGEVTPNG